MLSYIIKQSLRNRLVVVLLAAIVLGAGGYVASEMEVDVFPDLTAPTVVVMTEAPGMAPDEVERLVSFPVETAVNGATSIRRVRSQSAMGFSLVWVEFEWDMDVYNARQIVSEKLATIADQLPNGIGRPTLAPQSSIMGEIMLVAITADSTSLMDLRSIAEWNFRPQLLSVGGVAQVSIIGGDSKEYQVLADPLKMKAYGVSFQELEQACRSVNENVSGGFINEFSQEYIIRGIGRTHDLESLGSSLVAMRNGMPVKMSDLARVVIGAAPKIGDASYRGGKAVVMLVTKQPGVNTLELSGAVKTALAETQKSLPADVAVHTDIFDQSQFIQTSVNNVRKALLEGSVFVFIVLLIFLMNYRITVISILAIPVSLLVAVLIMKWMGISINTMTLGGMTIAIGSLVDDAIIDVENVYKRLRENVKLPEAERKNPFTVIFDASVEIRASILNATLIIIVAFLPLFFLSGMEGRMLKPLGIAYIVSLFASLLVAVTLIPVMSSYLLTNDSSLIGQKDGSAVERWLGRNYPKWLLAVLNRPKAMIYISAGLFLFSVWLMSGFGRSFLPPFNEGSLTINLTSMPGINLEESNKLGQRGEAVLLSIPEITSTARRTGRAELAEHVLGVNVSEIDAPFELKDRSREAFLKDVRQKLSEIKGVTVEVGQPLSHRMDASLSGSKANVAIKLFGTDLGQMFAYASQAKQKIEGVEGIADLTVEQQIEVPQLIIKPKREMLARYGIPMNDFLGFIDVALGGAKMSDVFESEKSFALVLRFDEKYRSNIDAVKNALIDTDKGEKIPLYAVADVVSGFGPNTIGREKVMRKIVVNVNVAGRDVRSVVNDIKTELSQMDLPENYWFEYGGQFESEAEASRILLIATFGALLVIFMLLYMEFKHLGLSLVILTNLPLSLIGGVLAVWMTSSVISIPAIIGFITLFGIATRNGILLISRYQSLKERGVGLKERVLKGSADRLSPILMTALTAALALIPLAVAGEKPGNEIQSPMAIVILGGLLSSSLLNIFLVPVIYYKHEKRHSAIEE